MKLKSLIMFSAAALAFAACSNDNEGVSTSNLEGTAVVKVNIQLDGNNTRVVTPGTPVEGNDLDEKPVLIQENGIVITLTAAVGGTTQTFSSVADANANCRFEGVRNPQSISVSINGGKEEDLVLTEVYNTGLYAKMYDETTSFVESKQTTTVGDETDIPLYTATLTPEHETALLEFSGIKHVEGMTSDGKITAGSDFCDTDCLFETINLYGLFLNNIKLGENTETTSYASWSTATAEDANPCYAIIGSTEEPLGDNFKQNKVWPDNGLCYSFNVFEGLPSLTLCFGNIDFKDNVLVSWTPVEVGKGYASVGRYKLSTTATKDVTAAMMGDTDGDGYINEFMPGFVYRFTDLRVYDEAVGPTPLGGQDVVIEAEVVVEPWILVSGTVEWN